MYTYYVFTLLCMYVSSAVQIEMHFIKLDVVSVLLLCSPFGLKPFNYQHTVPIYVPVMFYLDG